MCGRYLRDTAESCWGCHTRIDDPMVRVVLRDRTHSGAVLVLIGLLVAAMAAGVAMMSAHPAVWGAALGIGTYLACLGGHRILVAHDAMRSLQLPASRLLKG